MLRKMLNVVGASIALLLFCFPSLAQDKQSILVSPGQMEIKALSGLDSIRVEVEGIGAALDLRRDMEQRLKRRGLPVVASAFRGRLLLSFTQVDEMVLVRVRLLRLASLTCESDLFYTPMWERERLVKSDGANRVAVELIDTFVADYNSINRK